MAKKAQLKGAKVMAASKGTIEAVARILIEEAGIIKAARIGRRLAAETRGNQSYEMTVKSLAACLNLKAHFVLGDKEVQDA